MVHGAEHQAPANVPRECVALSRPVIFSQPFCDQAHLSRTLNRFTGMPLAAWCASGASETTPRSQEALISRTVVVGAPALQIQTIVLSSRLNGENKASDHGCTQRTEDYNNVTANTQSGGCRIHQG